MKNLKTAFLLFAITCLLSACSTTQVMRNHDSASSYKIRPGDIIEVKFEYYPDFDQTLIVQPDGAVSLNAVGKIDVIDLTSQEMQGVLYDKFGQMLAMPNLQVNIHESVNFTVYVGGDIKSPGIVKFKSKLTLVQGILLAGGLKATSTDYEVFVFRSRGEQGMKTFKFDLNRNDSGKKSKRNFQLAPYDVVFVMKSTKTAIESNEEREI